MTPEHLVLEFQIRSLHDLAERLDVRVDPLAKFLAGTGAGVDCHGFELLPHARILECAPELGFELLRDWGWGAGKHETSTPQLNIYLRESCLGHARHIRQLG